METDLGAGVEGSTGAGMEEGLEASLGERLGAHSS